MAKRASTEERLRQLRELGQGPMTPDTLGTLRKALSGKNAFLAEAGAAVAAERRLDALVPDLIAAFDRFMTDPAKSDKGCRGKCAIVDALSALGYDGEAIFLRGLRHVQPEPAYGGHTDTAAVLRGKSALALVRLGYGEILFELADLLMDPELEARRYALQGLIHVGLPESELILRVKALAGDASGDLVSECLAGLMRLSRRRSLPFLGRFVDNDDPVVAEGAALAVGELGGKEGFELLRRQWEADLRAGARERLLLPLALNRTDEAFAFLVDIVRRDPSPRASAALRAMTHFSAEERRRKEIEEAVRGRGDPALTRLFEENFR